MIKRATRRKLVRYIRTALAKKVKKEVIKDALVNYGWPEGVVTEAFEEIERKPRRFFIELIHKEKAEPKEEEQVQVVKQEKKGLNERVDEINEKLDMVVGSKKSKKDKPFALSFGIRRHLSSLTKKDAILVFLLTTNRAIKPIIAKIQDEFIVINNVPHTCTVDFVFLWRNKYPAIIVPEWDIHPIGTKEYYEAIDQGRSANAGLTIIRMIEKSNDLMKKQMNSRMLIWFVIGGIIIAYLIFGNLGGGGG